MKTFCAAWNMQQHEHSGSHNDMSNHLEPPYLSRFHLTCFLQVPRHCHELLSTKHYHVERERE